MKVIFYGAGSYLARNMKRLKTLGYEPVCVCDSDKFKWHKPFCGDSGLFVLPLNEAMTQFPVLPLYVTVDNNILGKVLHFLSEKISTDKILNWQPIEQRLGCNALETTVKVRTKRVFARCYWRHPGIDRTGNVSDDLARFEIWRKQTLQDIKDGKPTPCDGCEHLTLDWYPVKQSLSSLQISESDAYSFCNFNCSYCFTKARNRELKNLVSSEDDEQLDMLRYVSANRENRSLELQFSTGELTVHPHRDEILELFEGYETTLFTNAGIYNEKIADLMSRGLLTIVVSMDCGTAEAFFKIKGVDCYNNVLDNLTRYSKTGGCIVLKYIMLSGVNDNDADVDGFVTLACGLNAVVQLSNDTRTKCRELSADSLGYVCRIAEQTRKANLLIIHEKDVFSDKDNVILQGVIKGNEKNL